MAELDIQKSLNDMDRKPEIIKTLEQRVYREAFDYIEIPRWTAGPDGHQPVSEFNDQYIMAWSRSMGDPFGKFEQYAHELRIACYSIRILDFLGITDKDWRIHYFVAALLHDQGKIGILEAIDKKSGFTQEDMEKMRNHPTWAVKTAPSLVPVSTAIVERHHAYQPDPYPDTFLTPSSPEIEHLAKVLGIIDFHDSVSTRINTKFDRTFFDRITRKKLPSKKRAKSLLIEAYGNLDLTYKGKILPACHLHGREFIEMLYKASIFGPENPINPFEKPFSFTYPD